jgi:hypothetical protein
MGKHGDISLEKITGNLTPKAVFFFLLEREYEKIPNEDT